MTEPNTPREAQKSLRRFSGKGLSLKTVGLTFAIIVTLLAAGGLLLRRIEPEFELLGQVTDSRVEQADSVCTWFIDFDLRNASDRSMSLRGVELQGIDGSGFGILGSIPAGETVERTYQYVLPDCDTEPATLGADQLKVNFTLRLSTVDRSTTIELG